MSIKCVNKGCGWYKSFTEGQYRSNCKMAGITKCDFSNIVTKLKETDSKLSIEKVREKFESHYTEQEKKNIELTDWYIYRQALKDFGLLEDK